MNTELYARAEQALPTIREAVAACYLVRIRLLNGGSCYQDEQCKIRIELSRETICLAIQNNIEGALIGKYGAEQGTINSAEMLNAMIDQTQQFEKTGGLSELGVTLMNDLFKSLADMAYESLSQGQPLTAAMNQPIH